MYSHVRVRHVDLLEPGTFNLQSERATVFIRCASDDLVPLEHKPDYPTSEFHITICDEASGKFGSQLLSVLKEFRWCTRLTLPKRSRLETIEIRPRDPKNSRRPQLSPRIRRLFLDLSGEKLSWRVIDSLSDERRLQLARRICGHLQASTSSYPRPRECDRSTPHSLETIWDATETVVHLTPPELAREIAEFAATMIAPHVMIDFGDPAVGTGAFYSALLQVMPRNRIASAIGIDVNRSQVSAANQRWGHRGMETRGGDYLHMERLPQRNLILANPPYLRHQSIERAYKARLRERASIIHRDPVDARAGLYVYFVLLAHPWMAPDAVAAWLIPSAFMEADYGAVLRRYLTQEVELVRVHQFRPDDPKFENAKVLPAVLFLRNRVPAKDHFIELTAGGTVRHPQQSQRVVLSRLHESRRWSIPMPDDASERPGEIHVGDLFEVHRGVATGANEYFVLERSQARKLGLPEFALRPLLPKARQLNSDLVADSGDGYPDIPVQLCLVDCDLDEATIRTKYPRLASYLEMIKSKGVLNRTLVRERHPWYRQERRQPAPYLCTYMGRGSNGGPPLRFIWNESQAIATNTYLLLYPKPELENRIRSDRSKARTVFELLKQASRETINEIWRIHAGGMYKIEPGELRRVRLSTVPLWLAELVGRERELTGVLT